MTVPSLSAVVLSAIFISPFSNAAHAATWCIEEYLEKRLEYARNFKPIPEPEWKAEIETVAEALDVGGLITPVPCAHGNKVIAQTVADHDPKSIPAGEYIIYDPEWVREVVGSNKSELHFLIGHELGHFALRHFYGRRGLSQSTKEKEADGMGACAVAKLGGDWHSVQELIMRLRTDGRNGYPSASESIMVAKAEFVSCGGITGDICSPTDWDIFCPQPAASDWTVDLLLFLVTYHPDSVQLRTLELRTNSAGANIAHLSPETFVALGEPIAVSVELRRLKKADSLENFGLMDFASFSSSSLDVKAAVLKSLYSTYYAGVGNVEGQFRYSVSDSKVSSSSNKLSATISPDLNGEYWSIVSRLEELSSPIEPNDTLMIFTEISYPADPTRYYSSIVPEHWGATRLFPLRNSFYLFDTQKNEATIKRTTFQSYVKKKDGTSDDDDYEVYSGNNDSFGMVVHKSVPKSTGIRIEYSWMQ